MTTTNGSTRMSWCCARVLCQAESRGHHQCVGINCLILINYGVRTILLGRSYGSLAKSAMPDRVGQDPSHRLDCHPRILRRKQQAVDPVRNQLRQPTDARREHWNPAGHCLKGDEAKTLHLAAHYQEVRLCQDCRYVKYESEIAHIFAKRCRGQALAHCSHHWAIADHP